ncbi:MAG: MBL fold metallo-hydrolase [Betaproteobacteria bacterium]|nr:MBL fold metallo-hydrolase [Betaproteobacteria bacterium]
MRFASIASGSKGNCLVAESDGTRLLLDCGLAPQEIDRRLARLGVAASSLSAILVTHEHEDHAGHAFALAARHGIPLYLTHGTRAALEETCKANRGVKTQIIDGRSPFGVGGLQVRPFTVPHDAREPVQFVLSDGAHRLGVLTDLGASTAHVEAVLSGCDALVLECNHDLGLLWGGEYPKWLKERIAGPFGHLDNSASERLLMALDRSRLRHVVAAHLSQPNNRAELARAALARALGCAESWVAIATQDEGFGWRELR